MKTLLVDLSILRHPYCGLGQIALNYGRWYQQHARELTDLDITLLVPKNYIGAFGSDVHYLKRNDLRRSFPRMMPRYDIWHAINQASAFRPWSPSTRFILTIHDVNFVHEKADKKQRKYLDKLVRKCRQATEYTFISKFAHDDTARVIDLGNKPYRIIYNGVEDLTAGPQEMPKQLAPLTSRPLSPRGVAEGRGVSSTLSSTIWLNIGGQLVAKPDMEQLIADVENGTIASWPQLHTRMDTLWEAYPEQRNAHAYSVLCRLEGTNSLSDKQWQRLQQRYAAILQYIEEQKGVSRHKDEINPFRNMTYWDDAERDAVLNS